MDGQAGKFVQLYEELEATGAVRPWLGELEEWSYEPLHETARAAHQVLAFMDQNSKIVPNKQTRGG